MSVLSQILQGGQNALRLQRHAQLQIQVMKPHLQPLALFAACISLMSAMPAAAQSPNLVIGGTVTDSPLPGGGRWAWIFWNSDVPDAFLQGPLAGSAFAIYQKNGGPDSTDPYTREAVMQFQNDVRTINSLIERSQHVGQSLAALESSLNPLLNDVLPELNAPDFRLADKISVLLASAREKREFADDLSLVAASHPAIQLARGHAAALPIGLVKRTYELRLVNAAGAELSVVGRVTLDGGQPAPRLPAPGAPIFVMEKAETTDEGLGSVSAEALNAHRQHLLDRTMDRAARLRWATPDSLRRVGAMHAGFNLFRVDVGYANGIGWDNPATPPEPDILRALAEDPAIPEVSLVNRVGPVAPAQVLTAAEAVDVESDIAFVIDDRRINAPEFPDEDAIRAAPYANGTQYYYFATARDVLGRDGMVSPRSEIVTMTTRLPPSQVFNVRTDNVYLPRGDDGPTKKCIRIHWEHAATADGADRALRYHVFRWPTPDSHHRWLSQIDDVAYIGEDGRFYGRVSHPDGLEFAADEKPSFLDESPDAPDETIPRKVFWYTIVATDHPAPGVRNPSGHSAPVDAIIREWKGPGTPVPSLTAAVFAPAITPGFATAAALPPEQRDEGYVQLQLVCTRPFAGFIHWVEFTVAGRSTGRVRFPSDATEVIYVRAYSPAEIDAILAYNNGPIITARVGSDLGTNAVTEAVGVSNQAILVNLLNQKYPDQAARVTFASLMLRDLRTVPGDLENYVPLNEDPETGERIPDSGNFEVEEDMVEWRIYRSVDASEPMLISTGYFDEALEPGDLSPWVEGLWDDGIPGAGVHPSGGRVCYHFQVLDMDGNPSPFVIRCINHLPRGAARGEPTQLDPVIQSFTPVVGPNDEPRLRLRWTSAVAGPGSFTLFIFDGSDTPPIITGVPGLSGNLAAPSGVTLTLDFGLGAVHSIPAIYARMPDGNGGFFDDLFEIEFAVTPGRLYHVVLNASIQDENTGLRLTGLTEPVSARWYPPHFIDPGEEDILPWSRRGVDVRNKFIDGIHARFLDLDGFSGIGVRIGTITVPLAGTQMDKKPPVNFIRGHRQASEFVYHTENLSDLPFDRTRKTALPCALYRYRVIPGADEDDDLLRRSDFVQVTPLIERIALESTLDASDNQITVVSDPFFRLAASPESGGKFDVYLVDRHPVVRGESYRYALVRFDARREIDFIHPVKSVNPDHTTATSVKVPEP
jgi:hypothetical protein